MSSYELMVQRYIHKRLTFWTAWYYIALFILTAVSLYIILLILLDIFVSHFHTFSPIVVTKIPSYLLNFWLGWPLYVVLVLD